MRLPRIYTPARLRKGYEVALTPTAAGHVARVLRLQANDAIGVFDGDGNEHCATITSVKGAKVIIRIDDAVDTATESALQTTLIQGISRGERMDFVVQKATELGVTTIVPVTTTRSVVKLGDQAQKKQEHWRNVAIGACEQSGRVRLPQIGLPVALTAYLAETKNDDVPRVRVVLDPLASQSLQAIEITASRDGQRPRFELLIGPEGGFDQEEIAAANRAGFVSVRLGPRILRTETAAVAALTVLQAKWGDLM